MIGPDKRRTIYVLDDHSEQYGGWVTSALCRSPESAFSFSWTDVLSNGTGA